MGHRSTAGLSLVFGGTLLALAGACGVAAEPAVPCTECGPRPPPTVCNGRAELCGRGYDAVTFPGTHDAYSNVAQGFEASDQSYPIQRQLEDGVRVLHLEFKPYQDDVYLCHGPCELGSALLADVLTIVKTFIDNHPDEVITLLMESTDVPTEAIGAAVQKSGLLSALHPQARGQPWPTLGAMIQSRQRVVALHADLTMMGGTSYPWLNDRFAWTWETPWDNSTPQDFTRCSADRGSMGNSLYVVDTYREDQLLPSASQASPVNTNPFLIGRILHCKMATGTLPNFVMVNYYEIGDLFHDVDVLNGFAPGAGDDTAAFPPVTSWTDGGMSPDGGRDASNGD